MTTLQWLYNITRTVHRYTTLLKTGVPCEYHIIRCTDNMTISHTGNRYRSYAAVESNSTLTTELEETNRPFNTNKKPCSSILTLLKPYVVWDFFVRICLNRLLNCNCFFIFFFISLASFYLLANASCSWFKLSFKPCFPSYADFIFDYPQNNYKLLFTHIPFKTLAAWNWAYNNEKKSHVTGYYSLWLNTATEMEHLLNPWQDGFFFKSKPRLINK